MIMIIIILRIMNKNNNRIVFVYTVTIYQRRWSVAKHQRQTGIHRQVVYTRRNSRHATDTTRHTSRRGRAYASSTGQGWWAYTNMYREQWLDRMCIMTCQLIIGWKIVDCDVSCFDWMNENAYLYHIYRNESGGESEEK